MWLYYLLKSMSWIISHLPYKLVVKIGLGLGRLYYIIAKKTAHKGGRNNKRTPWLFGRTGQSNHPQPVYQAGRNFYGNYVYAGIK